MVNGLQHIPYKLLWNSLYSKLKTIRTTNIMDNHGTCIKSNDYDTKLIPFNSNVVSTILAPFHSIVVDGHIWVYIL